MATQPTERIPIRSFRASDDLWRSFTGAVGRSPDPEATISLVLRQLLRWYAGEPGAKLPERPTPVRNLGLVEPGTSIQAEPGTLTVWDE